MGKKETMESSQSLWHNRRMQRSAGFATFILIFILLGLYSRRNWPEDAAIIPNLPSAPKHTDMPSKSDSSNQELEEPLQSAVPEYDTENMPTVVSDLKSTDIPTKSDPSNEKLEDPLYSAVPEYDTENMPTMPSSVAEINKPIILPVLDPSRVALIIETRAEPSLPAVLMLFINGLPPQWTIRLVGSQEAFSIVMLSSSLARHIKTGKLTLTDLPDSYKVEDSETLSTTLTDLAFYSEFLKPAEWLLLFQTDSVICAASEQTLDDWVDKGYTWVGAPWNPEKTGGNGGLSLRHVPSIIKILQNETRAENEEIWEDRWLCDRLKNIAPPPVAKTFSVESVYYERPMGYHLRGSGRSLDPDIWHNNTRKRQILRYCPETKIILGNMQLQSLTEKEDEQKDLAAIASAIEAAAKKAAPKVSDEKTKQVTGTDEPTSAIVSSTNTITNTTGPTETDGQTEKMES